MMTFRTLILLAGGWTLAAGQPAQAVQWRAQSSASTRAISYPSNVQTSASEATCNGVSFNCTAAAGFTGSHSATNPSAVSAAASAGYVNYGGPYVGPALANAAATSDLRTGELTLSQLASSPFRSQNTASNAQASFYDTLHFSSAGSTPLVPIAVTVHVDGSIEGYNQPRFAFAIGSLSTGIVGWGDASDGFPSTTDAAYFIDFGGGTGRSGTWTSYGPSDFVGIFNLDPTHPDVAISMYLTAGGSTEYGNTFADFTKASVSFQLPTGVTFTSDSGAFLSAAPVPEPGEWAMMLGGLSIVGSVAHRRRK